MLTIWHNPRCSKSRETLALLQARGFSPLVVDYQATPPAAAEIERVLGLLGLEPRELMRKGEDAYAALADDLSRAQLIQAMAEAPKLIERPVVINGDKAAIGRPPETVLAIL